MKDGWRLYIWIRSRLGYFCFSRWIFLFVSKLLWTIEKSSHCWSLSSIMFLFLSMMTFPLLTQLTSNVYAHGCLSNPLISGFHVVERFGFEDKTTHGKHMGQNFNIFNWKHLFRKWNVCYITTNVLIIL